MTRALAGWAYCLPLCFFPAFEDARATPCESYIGLPRIVGEIDLGTMVDLDVSGTRAVAITRETASSTVLHVLDVADPGNPALLSSLEFDGSLREVVVSGDLVWIAGFAELSIVDASDPARPFEIALPPLGPVRSVAVAGDMGFLAQDDRFTVLSLVNPADPKILASVPVTVSDLAVAAGCLLTLGGGRLSLFDVSDPADPELLAEHDGCSCDGDGACCDAMVELDDRFAYVSSAYSSYTDDASPRIEHFWSLRRLAISDRSFRSDRVVSSSPRRIRDFVLRGSTLVVTRSGQDTRQPPHDFSVYDVHGEKPVLVGSLRTAGPTPGVAVSGPSPGGLVYAAVATGIAAYDVRGIERGVQGTSAFHRRFFSILDLEQTETGELWALTFGLYRSGLPNWYTMIERWSADDDPVLELQHVRTGYGFLDNSDHRGDVEIASGDVYISGDGLGRYDVTESGIAEPRSVGGFRRVHGTEAVGSHLLVAGSPFGVLETFPDDEPVAVYRDDELSFTEIAAHGDLAAAIGDSPEAILLDVAVPSEPTVVGRFPLPGIPERIALDDRTLVVAIENRVHLIDLRASPPRPVGSVALPERTLSLALSGRTLYAMNFTGCAVVDVRDPARAALLGVLPTEWPDRGVLATRERVYYGAEAAIFTFLPQCHRVAVEGEAPDGRGRSPSAPNPFRTSTSLRFLLSVAGSVRAQIFDVRGRLVRDLGEGWRPSGEHRVAWDGVGVGGAPVPPGVYFLRVDTPGGSETRKLVRLR